jgi:hypothetical protein
MPIDPVPYDPGDPVAQTLQAMGQQGQLAQTAPAQQHLAPEGYIDRLMHNLVHNSVAAQDSGIVSRGVAALFDALNAPHAAVQTALNITPESQMEMAKRAAQVMPAPNWGEFLNPVQGFQSMMMRTMAGQNQERWSPETLNMGADMALDPTTYLGVGLFKGLAKGAAKVGLPKAVPVLEKAAAGDEAISEAMGKAATGLVSLMQKGLLPVNQQLGQRFPDLVKWTDYYKTEQSMGTAVQWLQSKGWDLPGLRASLIQANGNMAGIMGELPTALRSEVDPQHLALVIAGIPAGVRPSLKRFGQGLPKNPQDDAMVALDQYRRWLRNDMALSDPQGFAKWYGEFNDWFKKQALGSLNYLLQNLQGGAAMGQMVGVGADKTLAEALDQSGNIAKGVPFTTSGAQAIATKTGIPVPYALHEQADRALNAVAGKSGQNNPLRDSLALSVLGGIGAGPAGALLGGAMGSRLAAVSDRLRKSSQGIETILRERGWQEGMSRELVKNMADMERIVVDGLTAKGARATGTPVHQNFIDNIVKDIQDNGGQINSEKLRTTLTNSVRLTQDRADDIVRQLDDVLYNASKSGVDLSNKFNFDYQDLSPIERVISEAFPFSTWFLKASPFYAEQAMRHPVIGNIVRTERSTADMDAKEKNLSPRFNGMLPMGSGSGILSAILGRPVEAYNDPLRGFIPFAGASQALARLQYEDPEKQGIVDKIHNALDVLGLQPTPGVDMILRTAGLVGQPDDPARGYLRWAAPAAGATALTSRAIEAATGYNPGWNVDVNRGSQRIEEIVRKAITGQDVTNPLEVQAERRVDELALRTTGKPIGDSGAEVAPYVTARRTHSGPIWEQAKAEVELEKGVQALAGFVSQDIQPQAILTGEEGQIREAKKGSLMKPDVVHALDQAAEKTPNAPADAATLDAVKGAVQAIAQQTGKPTPDSVAQRLASPTYANLDWISKEVYKWEVEQQPLTQGYGTSGTPEQRALGNATSGMAHAGQDLTPEQRALRIQANRMAPTQTGGPVQRGAIASALQIPGQERDEIQKSTPYLEEYLTWRKTHPSLDVADFLAQKFGK